ncbi:hypothetical protein [Bacillus sp. NPDC094106]|uniref:hypothetical protein n=1 Tax=Bacillus sp. NPDC094106 TaxID=3363949 RepID=UPI003824334C
MRKPSMMGSSKYEFHPEQFDIDVLNNKRDYEEKKKYIKQELNKMILCKPSRMGETFSMMIQALRELKAEYEL